MTNETTRPIQIIGGGLAGSEAAWQIAKAGGHAVIYEMRPIRDTDAHVTDNLAELVCSNSFRSDDFEANAVGLLHEEMRRCGSLIMQSADANRVPAGGALAVDRGGFSDTVRTALEAMPNIEIRRQEITELPSKDSGSVIVATGPLTSPDLANSIRALTGEDSLAFFDAIAPIVYKDSVDFSKAWYQSRYDKGDGADYINCPMSRDQYGDFIDSLLSADKVAFKEWEKSTPYFEGCLPIEVMAERGPETLAFGPLKPVGLTNPHDPKNKPHAIVQLRQDNALGTLYNMVGFQTKLTHREQTRLFKKIPGLESARFARLGGLHRNTFINGPRLLEPRLRLKTNLNIRFAGQITGCEGYVESAAIGLLAGRFAATEQRTGKASCPLPPLTTALGALLGHVTGGGDADTYQPMNINFGLFPPIEPEAGKRRPRGRDRKKAYSARALLDLAAWLAET
ncbi:MAG: methylenetetrahydrofolate--tRNA-(uracil(54)-C(5))-methyltransferase (FADH(2)-oxidizing) TrmFO [Rhodospirillales bacterium]|nr:methylenetetrahydrofolate--tRNA-(uracil(54)-C(5))-methyltransferase (FADH(2)-oxidizing) TrmFO [Rhodospirillales bacterium]